MRTKQLLLVVMLLFASAAPVWAVDHTAFVNLQKKLAAQGDAQAQSALGFIYFQGEDVPQDAEAQKLAREWKKQ